VPHLSSFGGVDMLTWSHRLLEVTLFISLTWHHLWRLLEDLIKGSLGERMRHTESEEISFSE
jgi:hypothetical protein